jgi:hypothetical protein
MLIIDRIEPPFAVVETDSGHINIPLEDFDETPHEGDVIVEIGGRYAVCIEETQARRELLRKRSQSLWKTQ